MSHDATMDQCLLCGHDAPTYVDLCDRCARVFQATADRVAAILAPQPARPAVVQVPGQLELDSSCLCSAGRPDWTPAQGPHAVWCDQ